MAGFLMEVFVPDNNDAVGPLGSAKESSEKFADSYLQYHILKEVVEAIKALKLINLPEHSPLDEAAMKQLEILWTSIADDLKQKGIDA